LKRGFHNILIIAILLIPIHMTLSAQDTIPVSTSVKSALDTIAAATSSEKNIKLSPLKATMLAATFPGAGQIYTKRYWKVPIVYAGFGGLGYAVAYNSKWYNTFTKAYNDFTDQSPETASYVDLIRGIPREVYDPSLNSDQYNAETSSYIEDQLLNKVDYFRRYRDLSLIGIGAWYLLSILDANVDASLFDYDVSENINLSVAPFQFPLYNYAAVGVNLTFKINF
jgi:hypothetical protein